MIQNFISKLSPKEKKIFYVAVAFVLAALLDRLFIGPTMSRLKSLDDEIAQEENSIRGDLRLLSYKEKILKEDVDLSLFYAKKAQAEEEIIAEFLKKIEILATESKINLAKVSPADSKQKKGFIEYYADLQCDGTLENVAQFMYAINASADLLKVVTFNLTPKKAGSDEVIADMKVTKIIIDASSVEEAKQVIRELTLQRSGGAAKRGEGGTGTASRGGDSGSGGKTGTGSSGGNFGAGGAGQKTQDGFEGGSGAGSEGNVTGEINGNAMGGSGGAAGSFEPTSVIEGSSSEGLSQRLQIKGLKPDGNQQEAEKGEVEAVKPSVWERIMQQESGGEENAE